MSIRELALKALERLEAQRRSNTLEEAERLQADIERSGVATAFTRLQAHPPADVSLSPPDPVGSVLSVGSDFMVTALEGQRFTGVAFSRLPHPSRVSE